MVWTAILLDTLVGNVQLLQAGYDQARVQLNDLVPLEVDGLQVRHVVEGISLNDLDISTSNFQHLQFLHDQWGMVG